jgi:hypothetical protein
LCDSSKKDLKKGHWESGHQQQKQKKMYYEAPNKNSFDSVEGITYFQDILY